MEIEDLQRKIQIRNGSYVVTIPLQIIHSLGIQKNQYVRFAVSKNKIVIKPVEYNITKRDLSEANRDSALLDESESKDSGYRKDLAKALGRQDEDKPKYDNPFDDPNFDPLKKLRLK